MEEACLTPCTGVYADIRKDIEIVEVEDLRKFDELLLNYEDFKRGYAKDINYPRQLKGISPHKPVIIMILILLDYKKKTKLHFIKIYFATPTFDKILKFEKANMETKLSTIGGTMGLLTGFSIISGIEIVYFAVKIMCSLGRK